MSRTLPMTISADACLTMTLAALSYLPQADTEFLRKAMRLYGDIRVARSPSDAASEFAEPDGPPRPNAPDRAAIWPCGTCGRDCFSFYEIASGEAAVVIAHGEVVACGCGQGCVR
jgi:hypothetical protein